MHQQLKFLLAALGRVAERPPRDVGAFLEEVPEVGALPSPWVTWTLIGLVRHRRRQLWVGEIVNTRLQGDTATLATCGALGHPRGVDQLGPVPGLPEWEYYFHGRGCCLTHKVNGDAIDVDFWGDSAEYFDVFFYQQYLKSLRYPEQAEQRLRELHRSVEPICIAVTDLIEAGALTTADGQDKHPCRVATEILDYEDAIETLCRAWSFSDQRLWLAALIGDWPAAHEVAGSNSGIARLTSQRAEACRELRRKRLLAEAHDESVALRGLAELHAADPTIQRVLRSAVATGLTSAALGIIQEQQDPRWCPLVYDLLNRINPNGNLPSPHVWITALKILLRHGHRKEEVLAALPQVGSGSLGEGVLLALEHAPEHALTLVRRGLRSNVPIDRTEVAATLALIAKPWSERELLLSLQQSNDQHQTANPRAAILETGGAEAQRAVQEWELRNPHEPEAGSYLEFAGERRGPFFTFDELALKNCAANLRYKMDQQRERVMKLRDVVPPEPPTEPTAKPWWKVW